MSRFAVCLWGGSSVVYAYALELSLGILSLILLYVVCKKVVRKKQRLRAQNWERIFFPSAKVLFFTLGLYLVLKLFGEQFDCKEVVLLVKPFKDSIVVLCLAWMAHRWKQDVMQTKLLQGETLVPALSKIFSISIVLITGLMILRIFSLDIMPLLAFGGIGAAALGFAAKDVMSSFFGGLLLSVTRPFAVGDLILVPDRNVEGFVEEIGWCLTSIRDRDKRAMYLPNSLFSDFLLINASRRTGRRILETFRLRYTDFGKMSALTFEIKAALKQSSYVDTTSPVLVFLSEIGEYSLQMGIDVYTLHTSWKDYVIAKEEILKIVLSTAQELGAEMAYPVSLMAGPEQERL